MTALYGEKLDGNDFIKIFVLEDGSRLTSIGAYKGSVSWAHRKLCLRFKLRRHTKNIRIVIKVFNTTPNKLWKLDNLQICGKPKPFVKICDSCLLFLKTSHCLPYFAFSFLNVFCFCVLLDHA